VAQLSQRDRAAICISFGQKWKTATGRQYFADIIGKHTYFKLFILLFLPSSHLRRLYTPCPKKRFHFIFWHKFAKS